MESMDPQLWECCICFQLLLDPVVGSCGHDFCRGCLLQWAQAQRDGHIKCPQCRSVLAHNADGIKRMGVCIRMKQMLEKLYPDKLQERRCRENEEAQRGVVAQRAAAQQQVRVGRARYLRARRHHNVAPGSPPAQPTGLQPPPNVSPLVGMASAQMPGIHFALLGNAPGHGAGIMVGLATAAANSSNLPWRGQPGEPALAASMPTGQAAATTWVPPEAVAFTMGWWEAPSKELRRKRAARAQLRVGHP